MDDSIKKLLVDLDCLLDTRLGTVSLINGEAIPLLLKDNRYHERTVDDYHQLTEGLVNNEEFVNKYFDRDKEILKISAPTNIMKLLHNISNEVGEQTILYPDVELLDVVVNIYPYELNVDEQEVLKTVVSTFLYPHTKVSVVSLKLAQITPKLIKKEYDCFVNYNFNDWYNEHYENLTKTPIPRHTLFAPALYLEREPDPEEISKFGFKDKSPFEVMEQALMPYVDLQFLPANSFSLTNN